MQKDNGRWKLKKEREPSAPIFIYMDRSILIRRKPKKMVMMWIDLHKNESSQNGGQIRQEKKWWPRLWYQGLPKKMVKEIGQDSTFPGNRWQTGPMGRILECEPRWRESLGGGPSWWAKTSLKLWRSNIWSEKCEVSLRYLAKTAYVPYIVSHILIGGKVKLEK